jgi:hypothetical protein
MKDHHRGWTRQTEKSVAMKEGKDGGREREGNGKEEKRREEK